MARKISQLEAATDVTANDLLQVIDVEDGIMAASGTNKRITAQTLGNFLPVTATGSTTSRSLKDRFADTVNVKDFGAVGDGVTDDTSAIQAAISKAQVAGETVYFPFGTYNISSTITVPNNVKVNLAANTNVPRNLFVVNGSFYRDGRSPEADGNAFGRLFGYKTTSSENTNADEYNFGKIQITDSVSMVGSSGSKVNGLDVTHNFGGPNSSGGRHAINGRLLHGYGGPATLGPPNAATTDRNYVGTVGQVLTDAWEGGTSGSAKGGFFGLNAYSGASGNSTYIYNLTAAEFNTDIATGDVNRVSYHSGIQIASLIGTRGTLVDAAVSISNLDGSASGWKNGILFGAQNGRHAFDSDSTAIKINSPHDVTIDTTGIAVNRIIKSDFFEIIKSGVGCILDLGTKNSANASAIRWYSSGDPANYTHQIISSSTQLNIDTALLTSKLLAPSQDNAYGLGSASRRWSEIFASNGTINTSDERQKQQIRSINSLEKNVSLKLKSLIKAYKWNDAVESKNEKARIHFGIIAQDVKTAFEECGLNADEYGVLCYDEWQAVEDVKNEQGEVLIKGIESGNAYGVRYNELIMFILANL